MFLISFPDVVGSGVTVQIAPGSKLQVRFLKLSVVGSGTVRIGDANTSASQGVAITASSGVVDLELDGGDLTETFGMAQVQAYIPTGTSLTITAGGG
jgi:hypothetical protein